MNNKVNWSFEMRRLCGKAASGLERIFFGVLVNPFPKKPCFLRIYRTSLLKTLREKEQLLVTSYFSISHGVFYLFVELFAIFIRFEIVVSLKESERTLG